VRPAAPLSPDFEISFGRFADDCFVIEASTQAALTGARVALSLTRISEAVCAVGMDAAPAPWEILEWVDA
jgi:hypothetical protein